LFAQQPRILAVGTAALYADTLLIILVYEFAARYLWRPLLLRVSFAMMSVLTFDTLFFVTGSFVESPAYGSILLSDLVGKLVFGLVYAVMLTVYLRWFDDPGALVPDESPTLVELLGVLTYRQKYEVLRRALNRDALTGIYNRGYFDETLQVFAAASQRAQLPLTLLMIDIDHFKLIN